MRYEIEWSQGALKDIRRFDRADYTGRQGKPGGGTRGGPILPVPQDAAATALHGLPSPRSGLPRGRNRTQREGAPGDCLDFGC